MERIGMRGSDDRGFTLIEMMVVVTIIGILAAVAIPRYISYVKNSQTAEVSQISGTLVSSILAYADQQGLTPAAAATAFNNTQVNLDTAPAATADLTKLLPTLSLPASLAFNYTVSTATATSGPAGAGELVFCITANARSSESGSGTAGAGTTAGPVVLYSSLPTTTSGAQAAGWNGRLNNSAYLQGSSTAPGAGGYCGTSGAASQAFS